MIDYKKVLLNLLGSLCLCDHMGDVSDDVEKALEQAGMDDVLEEIAEGENFFSDLAKSLHKRGATTLYGTALQDDEEKEVTK